MLRFTVRSSIGLALPTPVPNTNHIEYNQSSRAKRLLGLILREFVMFFTQLSHAHIDLPSRWAPLWHSLGVVHFKLYAFLFDAVESEGFKRQMFVAFWSKQTNAKTNEHFHSLISYRFPGPGNSFCFGLSFSEPFCKCILSPPPPSSHSSYNWLLFTLPLNPFGSIAMNERSQSLQPSPGACPGLGWMFVEICFMDQTLILELFDSLCRSISLSWRRTPVLLPPPIVWSAICILRSLALLCICLPLP